MKNSYILLILSLSLALVGCGGGGDSKPQDCSINNVVETTDNGNEVVHNIVNNQCNIVTSYSTVNNVLSSITYRDDNLFHIVEYPQDNVRKVTRYNPESGTKILEINYEFWNNYIETVTYLDDGGIEYNSYTEETPEFLEYLLNTSAIIAGVNIEEATKSATFN